MISKRILAKSLIGSSLLFSVSELLAHNINATHVHQQSVPLSLTSTIVLGILLLATGLFVLPRMQGRHIRTLATTTLLAGIIAIGVGGKLVSDAYASLACEIDSNLVASSGCNSSYFGYGDPLIKNMGNSAIKVTFGDNGSHGEEVEEVGMGNSSSHLQIVKLVKGPIQRSEVVYSNCSSPAIIEAGQSCLFRHNLLHGLH